MPGQQVPVEAGLEQLLLLTGEPECKTHSCRRQMTADIQHCYSVFISSCLRAKAGEVTENVGCLELGIAAAPGGSRALSALESLTASLCPTSLAQAATEQSP